MLVILDSNIRLFCARSINGQGLHLLGRELFSGLSEYVWEHLCDGAQVLCNHRVCLDRCIAVKHDNLRLREIDTQTHPMLSVEVEGEIKAAGFGNRAVSREKRA